MSVYLCIVEHVVTTIKLLMIIDIYSKVNSAFTSNRLKQLQLIEQFKIILFALVMYALFQEVAHSDGIVI